MTEKQRFEDWIGKESRRRGVILRKDVKNMMLEAWQAARRWIPVSEALPEDRKDVLITDDYDVMIGFYIKEKGTWSTSAEGYEAENCDGGCHIHLDTGDIKRWQPLPEPPEDV